MGYIENVRKTVGHQPLILVGAVVLIINDNKILLQKRNAHPKGKWGIPGGLMELGESTQDTARREVFEETGLTVNSLNLIDVFSGKNYYVKVPNGDEFYAVTVAYYTHEFSGKIIMDEDESIQLSFVDIDDLPENIVGSHKEIIDKYFEYFGE